MKLMATKQTYLQANATSTPFYKSRCRYSLWRWRKAHEFSCGWTCWSHPVNGIG